MPLPFSGSAVAVTPKGELVEQFPILLSVVLRCFIISLAQDAPDSYRAVLLPASLQFLQKLLACNVDDFQLGASEENSAAKTVGIISLDDFDVKLKN